MQPESGGPQARQGRIYKPTIRSKLNPKRSYNSTGAFWWASHPMLLLVALQRINRPGNHITVCWLSSLGECTRQMMWGRSHGDIGVVVVEFHPTTTTSPPLTTGVEEERERSCEPLQAKHLRGSERITVFTLPFCLLGGLLASVKPRLGVFPSLFFLFEKEVWVSHLCLSVHVHVHTQRHQHTQLSDQTSPKFKKKKKKTQKLKSPKFK